MNFMNQAFILAKKALAHDDVPIGAVIVKDGKIIARGVQSGIASAPFAPS